MRRLRRQTVLIILLALGLLVSLGLNLFLFERSRQDYIALNEAFLDPLGLRYGAGWNDPPDAAGDTRVVFFGDSRAAQWTPSRLAGFTFVNRGIGAQTSAQVLYRFDMHVAPLHPQIVILQVGINDLKTIPLFPDRKTAIIADCEAHIRTIVERSNAIGAKVVLTTIFPVGEVPIERRPVWSPEVGHTIDQVNRFIRSLAGPDVIVMDAYAILEQDGIVRESYAHDLVHLNPAGYAALNEELTRVLAQLAPNYTN